MFSQVCVCLSTGGSPCDHYPWCIGPHCTGSSRHETWGPPGPPTTWDQGTPTGFTLALTPLLMTSWWPSLETWISNLLVRPHCRESNPQQHLVVIQGVSVSVSRQFTSYWNAFLLSIVSFWKSSVPYLLQTICQGKFGLFLTRDLRRVGSPVETLTFRWIAFEAPQMPWIQGCLCAKKINSSVL